MKKFILAFLVFAAGYASTLYLDELFGNAPATPTPGAATPTADAAAPGDAIVAEAYANRKDNVQVRAQGSVIKILPDDTQGSPHQRFIVRLGSGQTLLIAHNIELAPRIDALREGDRVEFFGEYEWNNKGGVIHWTHDDPQGRHVAGWIEHNGRRYD